MPPVDIARQTLFTTAQACEITGVSQRQLDHWVRIGQVITPSATPWRSSGIHRRWTADEVRIIAVLGQLASAHGPMTVLAAAAAVLAEVDPPKRGDTRWLIVDNEWAQVVPARELTKVATDGGLWFVPLAVGGNVKV